MYRRNKIVAIFWSGFKFKLNKNYVGINRFVSLKKFCSNYIYISKYIYIYISISNFVSSFTKEYLFLWKRNTFEHRSHGISRIKVPRCQGSHFYIRALFIEQSIQCIFVTNIENCFNIDERLSCFTEEIFSFAFSSVLF